MKWYKQYLIDLILLRRFSWADLVAAAITTEIYKSHGLVPAFVFIVGAALLIIKAEQGNGL